jgi:hypothetical protein
MLFDVAVTVSGKGSILPQRNRCDQSKKSTPLAQSENPVKSSYLPPPMEP